MAYDGVRNNVEDLGGQGFSLGNSVVPLEEESIVSACPGYHGKPSPVSLEEPERPGANPVRHENIYSSVLIQDV